MVDLESREKVKRESRFDADQLHLQQVVVLVAGPRNLSRRAICYFLPGFQSRHLTAAVQPESSVA
jgi:hypothetical protein